MIPNPDNVKILHKMITMYINGYSFIKIGNMFDMDERIVEKRILSRTNLGLIPYKGQEFVGRHEAVISQELYNKIIETNKIRKKSRTERRYLLSGKIYCGYCKAKYRYQKWGKRIICYCYSQQKSKPKYIKDPSCKNKKWDSLEIENIILKNLFSMKLDNNMFNNNYLQFNINEEYQKRLKKINLQINNLVDLMANDIVVSEAKEKIKELEKEKKEIIKIIKNEKNSSKVKRNLQSTWDVMTFEEKRMIILHIVDKVVINNNIVEIFYKIS